LHNMTSLTLRTQSWQEGSGLGDVAEKGVLTRYGAADLHAGRKSLNRWQANGLICCTAAHACMPRQAVIRGQSLLSSAAFAVADSREGISIQRLSVGFIFASTSVVC